MQSQMSRPSSQRSYSPSARWRKRERRGRAFRDNRLYNRYSLYNAVFNCRGKSRDRRETSIAVFFLSYAPSILEIQTETTMNHVLIDSTRDPLLFPPLLLYIDGEKEKGASRLASQNRFHIAKPGKKGIEAKDGRSFPFVFPLNCILGNWKADKNG